MLNTIRREELEKRLKEGKKQRAISINLFNFCNLILDGDTDFDLIYSSSREIYVGIRLKQELEGKSVLDLEPIVLQKKSIATTRSFPKQIAEFDLLRERIATFAAVCAEKLRKQHSCCHTIIVMLVIDKHSVNASKYYFNKAITLPYASNSTLTISNAAIALLKELLQGNEGIKFKKAGVIVTEMIDENKKQLHLFEEENPKHLALMQTIDQLNRKIGMTKVKLATQNLSLTWNMNQNHLSPKYTTKFKEILEIQCL